MHFTKGQESHPFCYTRGTWSRYFSKKGTVGGSEGGMRGQQKQPNQPRDQISVPSVTASKRTEPRPTCSSGFLRSGPQAGPSGTAASVPGQWSARGPSLPLKGKELCNGPSLFVSSWFCCCFVLFLKYSRAQRYVSFPTGPLLARFSCSFCELFHSVQLLGRVLLPLEAIYTQNLGVLMCFSLPGNRSGDGGED